MKFILVSLLLFGFSSTAYSKIVINENGRLINLDVLQIDFNKDNLTLYTENLGLERLQFKTSDINSRFNISPMEFSELIRKNNGHSATSLHLGIDFQITGNLEKWTILRSLSLVLE